MVDIWNCVHITCKNENGSVLKDTHSKILRNYKTKILSQNDKNKTKKKQKKTNPHNSFIILHLLTRISNLVIKILTMKAFLEIQTIGQTLVNIRILLKRLGVL